MYTQERCPVLSLKSLIDHSDRTEIGALRRTVSILLRGVSVYAFPFSSERLALFRSSIEALRLRFENTHNHAAIVELATSAITSIEEYSADAERFEGGRMQHMKSTVAVLTDSLLQASQGTTESVRNLSEIRAEIETISGLDNLADINDRLRMCLTSLAEEVNRQNQQREQIRAELKRAALADAVPEIDSSTGLPGAKTGSRSIRELIESGNSGRVLAFALDRIEAINQRFGFAVGDQVLARFAQHAQQRLHPSEILYRWHGPSFIALSRREIPETLAALEAARIANARIEHTTQSGERQISIAVSASWTVLPISDQSSTDEIIRKLDEFAGHRARAKTA